MTGQLVINIGNIPNIIIFTTISVSGRILPYMRSAFVVLIMLTLGIGASLIFFDSKIPSLRRDFPSLKNLRIVSEASVNSSSARITTALGGIFLPPNRLFFQNCVPYSREFSSQNISREIRKKLILFYNRPKWVLTNSMYVFEGCSRDMCELTDNRDIMQQADAVVVHVCRISDPHPPPARPPGQVWVAFGLESPVHYRGRHDFPAWRGVFNWTMTYRTDSDIFSPYGFLALRPTPPLKNYTQIALNKTKPVAWLVSNCNTQSRRRQYVQQLQNYIDVDVYGRCGTHECPRSKESECLRLLSTTYYFYLSFENSLCRDYVTEKFFKVFNDVNVIPVVRGGADYEQYFPPNTFINTADFHSPQHLATYLKSLMADTETYAEMLKTKDNFVLTRDTVASLCELCKKLHSTDIQQRVYPDLMHWTRTDMCRKPADV